MERRKHRDIHKGDIHTERCTRDIHTEDIHTGNTHGAYTLSDVSEAYTQGTFIWGIHREQSIYGDIHTTHKGIHTGHTHGPIYTEIYTRTNAHTGGIYSKEIHTGDIRRGEETYTQGIRRGHVHSEVNMETYRQGIYIRAIHTE